MQDQVSEILTAIMVHLAVLEVNLHGIKVIIESTINQDQAQDLIGEGIILLRGPEVGVGVEVEDIKIASIENTGTQYSCVITENLNQIIYYKFMKL